MFSYNEECLKCGLCAELCPARIIKWEKNNFPAVPADLEERCIRCGQCVCFCPVGSARLSFQPEAERVAVRAADLPTAEAAEIFLRSRRSIRRFEERGLDEALILRILESARFAPSAVNSQPVRWTVVKERKKLLELGLMTAAHFNANPAGDEVRQKHLAAVAAAQERGTDVIFRGAPQLALAVVKRNHPHPEDAAIALTYFELAAHALGVGCCWAGYFASAVRESVELRKALELAEDDFLVGGQMFGRPKGITGRLLPPRKRIEINWL